jgi:hypothetical protein
MLKILRTETGGVPTPMDFEDARVLYTQPEGLDSRVSRREDIHFPDVVMAGVKRECRDLTPEEQGTYADRCAGPAKVVPLINDALKRGAQGENPTLQSARIEAALVWFLWLSLYKESQGCYADPKQCDSTSSYWGGQQDVTAPPLGYGRYVRAIAPESFARGWDAVLAVRCAYDYFQSSTPPPAEFPAVRERVRDQIDRLNNHTLALILRSRLSTVACEPASLEFVRTLGPVLDVVVRAKNAEAADRLRAEWSKSGAEMDVASIHRVLDDLFGCP